jgi:hypothetical protein
MPPSGWQSWTSLPTQVRFPGSQSAQPMPGAHAAWQVTGAPGVPSGLQGTWLDPVQIPQLAPSTSMPPVPPPPAVPA